jgi:hypothetical protein
MGFLPYTWFTLNTLLCYTLLYIYARYTCVAYSLWNMTVEKYGSSPIKEKNQPLVFRKHACNLTAGKWIRHSAQYSHLYGCCIDWDALWTKFLKWFSTGYISWCLSLVCNFLFNSDHLFAVSWIPLKENSVRNNEMGRSKVNWFY